MNTRSLIKRLWTQTLLWLAAMGAVLFLAASDWRWPQGWVFLIESGVSSLAISLWLLRYDPALLESRLSGLVQRDQKPWDRAFMVALLVVFIVWFVVIALDARRFRYSEMPITMEILGAVLIALAMVLCWQVFRVNTFAAPQVRMQSERAQRVIVDGPYRFVRHPMYVGGILYFLGMPLLLGSWWGLLGTPVFIAGMSARIVGEERMLRRELAGYDAYAARVRYRLVPGLW